MTQTVPQSHRRRWLALIVLCAGMLMVILDQTIVNVALPSIQADLHFTQSGLTWVVNAYLIPFGGLLLLAGRLGDLLGRKRVFLAGLGLFTLASLLCGLSDSQEMLIATRFVQGIGGATAASVILGVIVTMFPEPKEQARAIGVFSFVAAGGASIGLLLGGVLTQAISWHWIFIVNVPIGVAAAALAVPLIAPERGIGLGEGADLIGAVLVTGGLSLTVYTLVQTTEHGWGSIRTLLLGLLSIALLAGFVLRQARASKPLLPLRTFGSREVSAANLLQMLMVAGLLGMFFLGALYMQQVLHYSALGVGLAFLPVAVTIGGLSLRWSAAANERFGPRAVLLTGLTLAAAGLALFARAPANANYLVDLFPVMLLLGLGAGLSFPTLMALAMSGAAENESGLASGLVNTTQQVGGSLGLAVLAAVSGARTSTLLGDGVDPVSSLLGGYRLAFVVAAATVAVAAGLALVLLGRRPAPAPERDESLEPEPVSQQAR